MSSENPELYQRAKRVFLLMLDCTDGERAERLALECGDDAALRAEVESLLDHAETDTDHLCPELLSNASELPEGLLDQVRAGLGIEAPMESGGLTAKLDSGELFADRYRMRHRLGAGGMGEVWLARDERLEEDVALKFVRSTSRSTLSGWKQRLLAEASAARRITHPNVCRVHDAGESGGELFLSMEYVPDGDLQDQLRQFGRLSRSACRRLANELTAALVAVHGAELLHRDLKPANVLIGADGAVRVSDFGLASSAAALSAGEARSGTRAYMAPEVLAGELPSQASDLFGLGLVLYEAMTNRRAFRSGREIRAAAEENRLPPLPSSLVPDVDPVLERVVRHCLAPQPENRPSSAAQLLDVLACDDPLEAVLKLGETPTTEVLALSSARGHFSARGARGVLAVAALLLLLLVSTAYLGLGDSPVPSRSPDQTAEVARTMLRELAGHSEGVEEHPHQRYGYGGLEDEEWPPGRRLAIASGRAGARPFWYRAGTAPLSPQSWLRVLFANGRVGALDPPLLTQGVDGVILNDADQLVAFQRGPDSRRSADAHESTNTTSAREAALRFAGLDPESFQLEGPTDDPEASTTRWHGSSANGEPRVVEVLHTQGQLHSFQVFEVESDEVEESADPETGHVGGLFVALLLLLAVPAAIRHARSGRGDLFGSLRLAGFCSLSITASWLLAADFPSGPILTSLFVLPGVLVGLGGAAFLWMFYMAIEPYVQREWPRTLVSWSRFLRYRRGDTLVHSHLLLGVTFGLVAELLVAVERASSGASLSDGPGLLLSGSSPSVWFASLLDIPNDVAAYGFTLLAALTVVGRVLRRRAVAVGVVWFIASATELLDASGALEAAIILALSTLGLVVLLRVGLLPFLAMSATQLLFEALPIAPSLDSWYAGASLFALAITGVVVGVAAAPYLRSQAPRPDGAHEGPSP